MSQNLALLLNFSILASVNIINVKSLSIESTNILNQMVGMMEDFCVRIDNSDGKFSPVYVALFNKNLGNRIISMGHYKSVNGEIVADPEVRFIFDDAEGVYYPSYYRQDCLNIEQESIKTLSHTYPRFPVPKSREIFNSPTE